MVFTVRSDFPIASAICFCVASGVSFRKFNTAVSSKVQFKVQILLFESLPLHFAHRLRSSVYGNGGFSIRRFHQKADFQKIVPSIGLFPQFLLQIVVIGTHQRIAKVPRMLLESIVVYGKTKFLEIFYGKNCHGSVFPSANG